MRTPELQARHHASAVVSKMMLICSRAMVEGYSGRRKNIAAVFPEILIAMAIRINDDRHKAPISISRLARVVGLPRQTVRRGIAQLIEQGVVAKSDDGYIGSDGYLEARLRARYFTRLVAAIKAAAHELRNFK